MSFPLVSSLSRCADRNPASFERCNSDYPEGRGLRALSTARIRTKRRGGSCNLCMVTTVLAPCLTALVFEVQPQDPPRPTPPHRERKGGCLGRKRVYLHSQGSGPPNSLCIQPAPTLRYCIAQNVISARFVVQASLPARGQCPVVQAGSPHHNLPSQLSLCADQPLG
jgi:hypothetical protein